MDIELDCIDNDVKILFFRVYILFAMDHKLNTGQVKWVFSFLLAGI